MKNMKHRNGQPRIILRERQNTLCRAYSFSRSGPHSISENVAIMAGYFLIKSIDENFIPQYFEWVKNGRSEDLGEQKFLCIINFDENLTAELMKLIGKILESRTKSA